MGKTTLHVRGYGRVVVDSDFNAVVDLLVRARSIAGAVITLPASQGRAPGRVGIRAEEVIAVEEIREDVW